MIQRAKLQLCTLRSVDIRTFATSTSEKTTVTSNVVIDLSDNMEIHETSMQVKSEQVSSVKSDLSTDADIVSVLQEMCPPDVIDEILSREDPAFLNRVLKNMHSNGLGNYSGVDRARYVSIKQVNNQACLCLILSNPTTNSHGEILGACRTINDLRIRIGGRTEDIPKVAELRKAGLDGIPIRNYHLVLRMFLPSDIITLVGKWLTVEMTPVRRLL